MTKRYVKIRFGTPFDMPEAKVRRSGTQSATQVVLASTGLKDEKLEALARMTGLTEISPWMLATDTAAGHLAEHMRKVADSACGRSMTGACLPTLLQDLDDWYKAPVQ